MQTAGKLLPEEDVPQLAQLITEILAITPGAPVSPPPPPALRRPLSWQRRTGAGSTAADVDKAVALGEAVGEAMLKRGGPKVTPMVKAPSAPAADPVAEDRQRQIDLLEAQKQEAVAAERCALPPPSCRSAVPDGSVRVRARYEEASELKQQIAEAKTRLVERRRCAPNPALLSAFCTCLV